MGSPINTFGNNRLYMKPEKPEILHLNQRSSDLISVQFKGFEFGCIFTVQKVFEDFSYLLSLCFLGST